MKGTLFSFLFLPPIAALLVAYNALITAPAIKNGAIGNTGDFIVGYRYTLGKPMTPTALRVADQHKDGKLNEAPPF